MATVRVPFFTGRRTVMGDYDPQEPLPAPGPPGAPPGPPPPPDLPPPEVGDEEGIAPPPREPGYAPDPVTGGGMRTTGGGRSPGGNFVALVVAAGGAALLGRAMGKGRGGRSWTAGSA